MGACQILQKMSSQEHFLAILPHPNHDEKPMTTREEDFFRDDYLSTKPQQTIVQKPLQ
jgi:hypothetical protein